MSQSLTFSLRPTLTLFTPPPLFTLTLFTPPPPLSTPPHVTQILNYLLKLTFKREK